MQNIGTDGGDNGTIKIPVYLLGDQPTTCPICGSRTDFEAVPQEDSHTVELHKCLGCGHEFYAENVPAPYAIDEEILAQINRSIEAQRNVMLTDIPVTTLAIMGEYGCLVTIEDGELLTCAILDNGHPDCDMDGDSPNWCEAPCVRIVVASLPNFCVNLGASDKGVL